MPPKERVGNIEQSEDDKTRDEMIAFCKNGGYSADEIRAAYYQVLGIAEEPIESMRVLSLVEKMNGAAKSGFPLNRFKEIVEMKQTIEGALSNFAEYVATLPVSDNEKRVLHSIVEKKRSGELSFIINGDEFAKCKIPPEDEQESREILAMKLVHAIQTILDSMPKETAYEITFTQ